MYPHRRHHLPCSKCLNLNLITNWMLFYFCLFQPFKQYILFIIYLNLSFLNVSHKITVSYLIHQFSYFWQAIWKMYPLLLANIFNHLSNTFIFQLFSLCVPFSEIFQLLIHYLAIPFVHQLFLASSPFIYFNHLPYCNCLSIT